MLRLAETARVTDDVLTRVIDAAQQKTSKGVTGFGTEAGQSRLQRSESEAARAVGRSVVVNIPAVVVTKPEAVLAVDPRHIVLQNIASVWIVAFRPETKPVDCPTLIIVP